MPLIGFIRRRLRRDLVHVSPWVTARRFDLDDVGAEVRQDDRGAGRRDEAREVHHLEFGKDVVACHYVSPKIVVPASPAPGIVPRAFRSFLSMSQSSVSPCFGGHLFDRYVP